MEDRVSSPVVAADSGEDEADQEDLYSDTESLDLVSGNGGDGSGMASQGLEMARSGVGVIDPKPHMSNQFYTFNRSSHHLMVQCILAGRHATAEEIESVATPAVLESWRSVWKDRHRGTAYLTGWKRIQDKLQAQVDEHGNEVLYFKNNPVQFVPFIEQWPDIVQGCHADTNITSLKHLGHRETLDRIRQVWTVGAKFYGIPESFVRVCITACSICGAAIDQGMIVPSPKRRRFEYTESFEVLANEVPQKLQQLAAKYKVVLCIRQKYIRYKPFLAEVKDYCCHRGGEPTSRKPGILKKKRYMSKRCGCSFRIRAIVPITNYVEKDKSFTYQEDGLATFKLYAVHSGHEPGPHEGSARIIHRFVDPTSRTDDLDALVEKEMEAQQTVLHRVRELQAELDNMEQNLGSISTDVVAMLCQDLQSTSQRLRELMSVERLTGVSLDIPSLMNESMSDARLNHGDGGQNDDYEGNEIVHLGETSGPNLTDSYIQRRHLGRLSKENIKRDIKVLKYGVSLPSSCVHCGRKDMFGNSISGLGCDCMARQGNECIIGGVGTSENRDGSLVGIPVENFCAENDKWFEGVSCSLDPTRECGNDLSHPSQLEFAHEIT